MQIKLDTLWKDNQYYLGEWHYHVRELEGTKLVVLCNLCEEENKVVWQSEWDSYELLLGNYSDGKVDGTLRPYECKVMRSI